jgi:uncharacterized membrane protein
MNRRPLLAAGMLMGIGMGGFLDGILAHQLLQIHNMLSARLPPDTLINVKVNMVWDGLFHVVTWLVTAIALALLWKAGKRRDVPWSGRTFTGSMIAGWGLFNLVEGVIDHHIVGIHHVIETLGLSVYDYAFLASGVLLVVIGWRLIRAGSRDQVPRIPGGSPASTPSPDRGPRPGSS